MPESRETRPPSKPIPPPPRQPFIGVGVLLALIVIAALLIPSLATSLQPPATLTYTPTSTPTDTPTATPTETPAPTPTPAEPDFVTFTGCADANQTALNAIISEALPEPRPAARFTVAIECGQAGTLILTFTLNVAYAPHQGFDLPEFTVSGGHDYLVNIFAGVDAYMRADFQTATERLDDPILNAADKPAEQAALLLLYGNSQRLAHNLNAAITAYRSAADLRSPYRWRAYNNLGLALMEYTKPLEDEELTAATEELRAAFDGADRFANDEQRIILRTNRGMALINATYEIDEGRSICQGVIDDLRGDWLPSYVCVFAAYTQGVLYDWDDEEGFTCADAQSPPVSTARDQLIERIEALDTDQPAALPEAHQYLAWYYQALVECAQSKAADNPDAEQDRLSAEVARDEQCRLVAQTTHAIRLVPLWEDTFDCPPAN